MAGCGKDNGGGTRIRPRFNRIRGNGSGIVDEFSEVAKNVDEKNRAEPAGFAE
jgi:hypothetical protein